MAGAFAFFGIKHLKFLKDIVCRPPPRPVILARIFIAICAVRGGGEGEGEIDVDYIDFW